MRGHDIGKGLGIVAHFHLTEAHFHADVDVWHAPSECHNLVAKGEARRERQMWRQVKGATGLKKRQFIEECRRRTGNGKTFYRAECGDLLRGDLSKQYPFLFGG